MTKHIALYGKGGVGKTTIAANLCAALAEAGHRVVLVGCDSKADSGALLHGRTEVPTLLDQLRSGTRPSSADIIIPGYRGITCIEVGDSLADDECAIRSIGRGLALLQELKVVEELRPDYVLYDMGGDIGCAGHASFPVGVTIQRALVVTSADLLTLHVANGFFRSITRHGGVLSVGLLGNGLTGMFEESLVADFARQAGTRLIGTIPRSLVVRQSELYGKTVIEAAPHANHTYAYRRLAQFIGGGVANGGEKLPQPLTTAQLKQWAQNWGDRLGELEFGIIQDGAGI